MPRFGVYLEKIILVAHAKRKGLVHRGGLSAYQPLHNDIQRFLRQERSADCYFTTMIDLYALPNDFPGYPPPENQPWDRVAHLTRAFAEQLADRRFIPFLQLHEFEAYLLALPEAFLEYYAQSDRQVQALKSVGEQAGGPELVDEGADTAPSKRILDAFPLSAFRRLA